MLQCLDCRFTDVRASGLDLGDHAVTLVLPVPTKRQCVGEYISFKVLKLSGLCGCVPIL